ncbi:hypothetical protein [Anabaena lutea]|uniref:ATP-binding protein n=1 Tax=Anabaena lutea FACHB-196 TaxID=2692881 RepID=A0ABR8FCX4_9NOST|nr:hypothetical protein [Anabaena lutea]MBD2567735.1 hypothetical protein [Anabaena lutea FACHB-196]
MQLNQIVTINESGMVANAVNFGMIADAEKNLLLCQGFVFNHSTLDVLDKIQKSYQSPNSSNIHLFVQDYGKGKSHFAVVAANYFKQLLDGSEIQGILNQIKIAAENNQGILEDLTAYKRRNPKHLVICISGDEGIDLRQIFLKSLRQTLENEGITDSLAQQLCQKPLEYLYNLTEEQINQVNHFLETTGNQFGDFDSLIDLLEKDNYRVISTVKEISRQLNKGFAIDFDTDLKIEEILAELINQLCSGENAKYAGILILFDELNAYLQAWAKDSFNSGGLTLQSITNICENNKSKLALVCFTQIRPLKSVPSQSADDYKKLASRLEIAESTYEPISSLELVIKALLPKQDNTNLWNQFFQIWNNTLLTDSRKSHEHRINIYRERGWSLQEFNNTLTIGCFPLHPLNSYLLCNLDFTQGRTAIQYIKEDVKNFINSQPVEKNGKLNYLAPISLIDAFKDNFYQPEFYRHYSEYQKAYDTIAASATVEEIAVLKGLLLFYVSHNKLHKPASEKHDFILSELTGLSEKQTKETLEKLTQDRKVIYFNSGDNTYRFYAGSNLLEISQEIAEEASKQANKISVNLAVNHCQKEVITYLQFDKIEGTAFIEKNQLLNDEWFFEYKFYSITDFEQALSDYKTIENSAGKGIFAYVLAETIEEIQYIRTKVNQLISQSKHKDSIAVTIPNKPVREICVDLLKLDIIRRKTTAEKQEAGTALQQLSKELQDKIKRKIKEVIASANYYCLNLDELNTIEKQDRESIVSHLLSNLYSFVPPIAKNDKMALKSSTGNTIIGYLAKRLLEDDLNPTKFPNQSYHTLVTQVFINSWGLFKTASQKYSVQIPTNKNVITAWNKIDELTALRNKQQTSINIDKIWQELSKPPFGYNEYTFTMLFVGWISYHRAEVTLKGNFGIPKTKKDQVSIEERAIKDWVTTNVFDKPKDFVNEWILTSVKKPQLIRSQPVICPEIPEKCDYNQAQKLIEKIDQFINSADPDQIQLQAIQPKREQILAGIKKIDHWFKPIETAEKLSDDVNLEALINIYPHLQIQLAKPKTFNLVNNSKSSVLSGTSDIVYPTQQQKQRHTNALKRVQDKINEVVEKLSEKSEFLKTEQEMGGYQVEVQTAIEKIAQVSLPQHLLDTLNYSLQVANRKLTDIQYQSEIKVSLDKIEILYKTLSNNATQQDYIDTINEIENLTNDVVKQESHYQQIINDIETKSQNLVQKIALWEERLRGITKNQALELSQEISQQQNRFTQPELAQKVQEILEKLNHIILENLQQQENQQETNIKKQDDTDLTLENINNQIQAIQSESIENQIIALFKQLPVSRRQELYQKLAAFLNNQEEN